MNQPGMQAGDSDTLVKTERNQHSIIIGLIQRLQLL